MLEVTTHNLTDEQITELAWDCHAFVGADMKCLCKIAALGLIDEYTASTKELNGSGSVPPLQFHHFVDAMKSVR